MRKSVKLADDARKAYLAEEGAKIRDPTATMATTKEVFVALSLGPFGSVVQPPQDFDGLYPPPFGPKGPSEDGLGNTRLFSSSVAEGSSSEEQKAIEALAQFHLWRLHAVASDPETWNSIDYVAFETVPHLREVRAIKLAMEKFDGDAAAAAAATRARLGGGSTEVTGISRLRGWWISLVFPNGEESAQWSHKEREHQTRGLLTLPTPTPDQTEILNVVLDPKIGAVPTGLGLNCTRIDQYPSILSSILSNSNSTELGAGKKTPPVPLTLVVYPNGGRSGDIFDPLTHRWKNDGRPRPDGRNLTWEEEVVDIVRQYRDGWKDIIVGGCCRVYPPQIKKLREKVDQVL